MAQCLKHKWLDCFKFMPLYLIVSGNQCYQALCHHDWHLYPSPILEWFIRRERIWKLSKASKWYSGISVSSCHFMAASRIKTVIWYIEWGRTQSECFNMASSHYWYYMLFIKVKWSLSVTLLLWTYSNNGTIVSVLMKKGAISMPGIEQIWTLIASFV